MLRVHGLRLDSDLTLAVKALSADREVAHALSTGSGLIGRVPMLRDMVLKSITGEKILDVATEQVIASAGEVIERLPTLAGATTKWLDQYQKGRFEVTVDTSRLSKEVGKLARLGREIVIALMLVGMLVGSAIATYGLAALNLRESASIAIERMAISSGSSCALILSFIIVLRLVWRWFRGGAGDED